MSAFYLDEGDDANWIAILHRSQAMAPPTEGTVAFRRAVIERAFDPNQPRQADGKWGRKSPGGVAGARQLTVVTSMADLDPASHAAVMKRMGDVADACAKNGEPGFPRTPEEMADGLERILDRATPGQTAAGLHWYDQAHDDMAVAARANGLTTDQGFAVTAVISPGRFWENNADLATKVMDVHGKDAPFTIDQAGYDDLRVKPPRGPGEYRPSELSGSQLSRVHPDLKGQPGYATGGQLDRAFRVARGEPIDAVLGGTKVRNFYNNIRRPDEPFSATIDSWQVRASISGSVKQVPKGAIGKDGTVKAWVDTNKTDIGWATGSPNLVKFKGDDDTTKVGVYPFMASAIQIAADRRGMTANQVQAITWTVYREEQGGG